MRVKAYSRPPSRPVLLLTLAVMLGACGGQPADPDSTPADGGDLTATPAALPSPRPPTMPTAEAGAPLDIDLCQLLGRTEVEAVVGTAIGQPTTWSEPPFYDCAFNGDPEVPTVNVGVIAWDDAAQAGESFDESAAGWEGVDGYASVPGVGERAFTTPVGTITVLWGRYEISVDIFGVADDETELAMGSELAARLLARLP